MPLGPLVVMNVNGGLVGLKVGPSVLGSSSSVVVRGRVTSGVAVGLPVSSAVGLPVGSPKA